MNRKSCSHLELCIDLSLLVSSSSVVFVYMVLYNVEERGRTVRNKNRLNDINVILHHRQTHNQINKFSI